MFSLEQLYARQTKGSNANFRIRLLNLKSLITFHLPIFLKTTTGAHKTFNNYIKVENSKCLSLFFKCSIYGTYLI